MKKKAIFRSLAAVTLLAALVLSFTACSSDEEETHRVYILTKLLAVCQEQEATLLLRLQL